MQNTASGAYSFAAGRRAKATAQGAFVWADSTDLDFDPLLISRGRGVVDNSFNVRATGGVYLVTAVNPTTGRSTAGVYVSGGGSGWNIYSDRNAKEHFSPADGRALLDRLAGIPIETWNYKTQDASIRHIGPMAQDFHAAFAVGEDERYINSVDADGVALAAIQGLYQVVQEKEARIAPGAEISALKAQNAEIEARLAALERQAAVIGQSQADGRRAMKRKTIPPVLAAWVLLIAALLGGGALAYAGAGTTPDNADFTLERAVIGAGGLHATGAGFELDATAGQPAAGSATGADFGIMAGFWGAPAAPPGHHLYLPLVLR